MPLNLFLEISLRRRADGTAGKHVSIKLLALVTALRTDPREEGMGLDVTQHGEEAYSRGEGAILILDGRTD